MEYLERQSGSTSVDVNAAAKLVSVLTRSYAVDMGTLVAVFPVMFFAE